MFTQFDMLDPAKRLALTYSRSEYRDVLTVLLMFDVRLSQIVSKGSEPLIGQMRMAWWRDALQKPRQDRPKGEPLFQDLASLKYDVTAALLHLVDAWEGLLTAEEWNNDNMEAFAKDRSAGIFGGYADVLGMKSEDRMQLIKMGQRWAMIDILSLCKSAPEADILRQCLPIAPANIRTPRIARSLSMLALSAEQSGGGMGPGLRMMWHGLTGR